MVRRLLLVATFVGMLSLLAGPASADNLVRVTYGDKVVRAADVASASCHDLDYPIIKCFATPAAMLLDAGVRQQVRPLTALTTGYVIAYEHVGYAGSQLLLSANEAWLEDLGWNDRISSLKSFGATGNFRENSPAGGFIYAYSATTQVTTVGSTYNDKFSAFYIN